jgi:RND family efflux transporter MFP subunit
MRSLHWALAAAAAAASLTSCSRGMGEASPAPAADTVPIVPVVKAARANLSSDLTLTAEFQPYQEVDVMAKVTGYVRSIKVDIGDRVKEGQVLATLEIPEMEDEQAKAEALVQQADAEVATARDELRRAESAHELAHLSYTRIQDVAKREAGLVPQQQVDEFRSRDMVSEAQVSAAKSALLTDEQRVRVARAEVARLRTLFRYTTITAPFTGVITKRYANVGAMIQAGSQSTAMPVVRLSQNNLLRLILPVPESAVSRVRLGAPVAASVPSMSRSFPGRVVRFADKVQVATRTMDTEVDVPNADLTLVPGMYAQVNLQIEQRDNALFVPPEAIDRSGTSPTVFTVDGAASVRIVPVTVGLETAHRVEIRSGLNEGDTVVLGRRAGLKAGDRVQPKIEEEAR